MIIRRELTWIRQDEHTFCFVVPGGRTRRHYTIKIMDQHPVITGGYITCLLYTSPSPRDISGSRMPSSA